MREVPVPRLCAQRLCPRAPSPAADVGEQPLYPSPSSPPQIAGRHEGRRRTARYGRSCAGTHGVLAAHPARLSTVARAPPPSPPAGRPRPGKRRGHQGGGRSTRADRRQGQPSRTPEASYRPSLSRMFVRSPPHPSPHPRPWGAYNGVGQLFHRQPVSRAPRPTARKDAGAGAG